MTRVHVITGSFGAGKTTAIRWLMSHKPESELWVVILNEFTDAGLDALSVAQSAQGNYDVRLVAGGCLCCVGELEFGKQLREILRNLKPVRLLIEPSGAGHAADIVDELTAYEAQSALSLDSIICLIDPLDAARIASTRSGNDWSQIQSADVLLMSKSDTAGPEERQAFEDIAAAQYPDKRYVGSCRDGALPPEALAQYSRSPRFSPAREAGFAGALAANLRPASAQGTYAGVASTSNTASDTASDTAEFALTAAGGQLMGSETRTAQLGFWAVSWVLPRELTFARVVIQPRILWMLDAYQGTVRRLKGVFRTGPGPSWLIQSHGRGLSEEDSAYRRDSRLEIVLTTAPTEEFLDVWRSLLRDAVSER